MVKKLLKRIGGYINVIFEQRIIYSYIFCFKYLPIEQARYRPIRFYKDATGKIIGDGKIILDIDKIRQGEYVHVGHLTHDFDYGCEKTSLTVTHGTLIIKGALDIRRGTNLDIRGRAVFGEGGVFGPRCRIRVHNHVEIGDLFRIAHETQIFDSNFHFSEKVDEPGFYPCSKPIIIGHHAWIGNRCTISPGVVLPDYITVASNSLVNKNFSTLELYSTIGGVPAKLLRTGWTRVWDTKREATYHAKLFDWVNKK